MGSARQAENPHARTQIKWVKLKHKKKHGVADQTVASKQDAGSKQTAENKVNG